MKVCILAAGVGEQLNSFSENLGEALLPIGNSTAISKIISKFPKDYQFIIAIGHKADLVQQYCEAVHSDLNITFVNIENYDGLGSGPGHSLIQCKPYLENDKFYLSTVDCLFDENVPQIIDHDWIGVSFTKKPEKYSTVKFDNNNNVIKFINRSRLGFNYAFIGIAFIYSPEIYWVLLEKYRNHENLFEFVSGWYEPDKYDNLSAVELTWNDTHSIENYNNTLLKYGKPNLGMSKIISEHTFLEKDLIIKITSDKNKNSRRIKRSEQLINLIPEVTHKSANVIAYKWVNGQEMYENDNPLQIASLLEYLQKNLWQNQYKKIFIHDFNKYCYDFYHNKTFQRYSKINFVNDETCDINGLQCLPVIDLLTKINFEKLSMGAPVKFHGDLQFQNIIFNNGNFTLIDWREDFSGQIECGDLFYDLAKLYACLILDYSNINNLSKSIKFEYNKFDFELKVNSNLSSAVNEFKKFVIENHIDINMDKIELLSALIWLNMSPLHIYPDNLLLFLYSKYYLNKISSLNSFFQTN